MTVTIEDILSKYPENVSALALKLRQFLLNQLKGITEQPDTSANIIGYGFGPGYKDMICTIILSKKGVKLGFYKGTELADPGKLLTGSGKVHKYVEINSSGDLNTELKNLLEEAFRMYKKRTVVNPKPK